mmetsp:Transcript_88392/g.249060  ORF Transcript_88392/g.249060 Transcript_88392/m.249060 type:complete len:205 (-) Transcript_88392:284-898(-)
MSPSWTSSPLLGCGCGLRARTSRAIDPSSASAACPSRPPKMAPTAAPAMGAPGVAPTRTWGTRRRRGPAPLTSVSTPPSKAPPSAPAIAPKPAGTPSTPPTLAGNASSRRAAVVGVPAGRALARSAVDLAVMHAAHLSSPGAFSQVHREQYHVDGRAAGTAEVAAAAPCAMTSRGCPHASHAGASAALSRVQAGHAHVRPRARS